MAAYRTLPVPRDRRHGFRHLKLQRHQAGERRSSRLMRFELTFRDSASLTEITQVRLASDFSAFCDL